jgi:hypothetical protein
MNILTKSERFSPEQLKKVEAHYEAIYVCETCVKNRDGSWANQSVSVFYQADLAKVPEGGSQWFGLFFRSVDPFSLDENAPQQLCIVNAISAVENDIDGIVASNGDVIYSRYRHDYRLSPDGSVMIDGGRDYTKNNGGGPIIKLRIVEDKLTIVEDAG